MAKLLLIRHGQSIKTDKDIVLTEKGVKQAKLLAKKLATINISRVYVSDSTRAMQTYKEYKRLKSNVPCIISKKLREIYRVIIGGPERAGTNLNREVNDRKRAKEVINGIFEDLKKEESIALFTHGNIIRYFIIKILNIPKTNLWEKLQINDASISLIEINNQKITIKMINNIEHLDNQELDDFYNQSNQDINYFS